MRVTLHKGDCLELMKDIPDGSVDLIVTDPPYLISKKSNFDKGGAWNDGKDKRCRKTPPKTDFGEWDKQGLDIETMFKEFYRVLKKGGTCLCFFDIWKMQELKQAAEYDCINKKHLFKQFRLIRWDKTNPVPVNSKLNYLSNASEFCLSCVKGSKPTFNSEYDKGIYSYPICSGKERTPHPTQKPLDLIIDLVCKHSNEGEIVFDPFMGSGTTGVACVNTNRKFVGIELDEQYFNIAQERINKAKSAWLDNLLRGDSDAS